MAQNWTRFIINLMFITVVVYLCVSLYMLCTSCKYTSPLLAITILFSCLLDTFFVISPKVGLTIAPKNDKLFNKLDVFLCAGVCKTWCHFVTLYRLCTSCMYTSPLVAITIVSSVPLYTFFLISMKVQLAIGPKNDITF